MTDSSAKGPGGHSLSDAERSVLRDAIKRLDPNLPDDAIERHVAALCIYANLRRAGRPAALWHGTTEAMKSLKAVGKKTEELIEALAELPENALVSFRRGKPEGGSKFKDASQAVACLLDLHKQVSCAHDDLAESKTTNDGLGRQVKGRKADPVVKAVTTYCATLYRNLTGTEPKRMIDSISGAPTGGFDAFLTSVFYGLGIDAVADSAIRAMARK